MATASWGGWNDGGGGGWNDGGGGGWNDGGGGGWNAGGGGASGRGGGQEAKKTKKQKKHEKPGQLRREYDRAPQLRQIAVLEARLAEVREQLQAEKNAKEDWVWAVVRCVAPESNEACRSSAPRTRASATRTWTVSHQQWPDIRTRSVRSLAGAEEQAEQGDHGEGGAGQVERPSPSAARRLVDTDRPGFEGPISLDLVAVCYIALLDLPFCFVSPCRQENRERISRLEKEASVTQVYKAPMSHEVLYFCFSPCIAACRTSWRLRSRTRRRPGIVFSCRCAPLLFACRGFAAPPRWPAGRFGCDDVAQGLGKG